MKILNRSRAIPIYFTLLALLGFVNVQAHEGADKEDPSLAGSAPALGKISFPTSTKSKLAQQAFIEGLLRLHLFEYPTARNLFVKAQKMDKNFAMAYWGEAMTFNMPICCFQDKNGALEALQKFAPTHEARLEKITSEKERDYFSSLEVLFGEGDKSERDQRYMQFMQGMAQRYPEDDEVQLFYALSILGVTDGVRDHRNYIESAAISQRVFYSNREHPGAAHYYIHGLDDPTHAPLGLEAAYKLFEVAPDASHALHMTSHIFNVLGMWPESINANIAAIAVAEKQGQTTLYVGHYPSWLHYALLQTGDQEEASSKLKPAYEEITKSNASAAGKPWDVNLTQALTLKQDKKYTLRFRAKGGVERELTVGLGLDYSPYTSKSEKLELTKSWQTYEVDIHTKDFGGENSTAFFFMGNQAGTVYLDDISLCLASADQGSQENLLANASFDDEMSGWKQSGTKKHSTTGATFKAEVEPLGLMSGPIITDPVTQLVIMWARYMIETRGSDSEIMSWQFKTGGAFIPELYIHYTKGLLFNGKKRVANHLKAFSSLKKEFIRRRMAQDNVSPAEKQDLERLEIMEMQLMANHAKVKGKNKKAIKILTKADSKEGAMPYDFGPPNIIYPSSEMLGEWLLEAGDYNAAAEAFREQLIRTRNKTIAVNGLEAAEANGG